MAADTYAGLAADGPGKKIRNLQVTLIQADGTTATVMMQVVALSDEAGNVILPVSARTFEATQAALLDELVAIRTILSLAYKIDPR